MHVCYISLDLTSGQLQAYRVDPEMALPEWVGLLWEMRWPIPPLSAEATSALLAAVAPHAQALAARVTIWPEAGVIMPPGAGTSVDRILRLCAGAWGDYCG